MTREEILKAEKKARLSLTQAENKYKAISHKLREELGKELRAIRDRIGIGREAMATLIKSNRGSLFAAEEPFVSKRYLSVEKQLELIEVYENLEKKLSVKN